MRWILPRDFGRTLTAGCRKVSVDRALRDRWRCKSNSDVDCKLMVEEAGIPGHVRQLSGIAQNIQKDQSENNLPRMILACSSSQSSEANVGHDGVVLESVQLNALVGPSCSPRTNGRTSRARISSEGEDSKPRSGSRLDPVGSQFASENGR